MSLCVYKCVVTSACLYWYMSKKKKYIYIFNDFLLEDLTIKTFVFCSNS